MRSCQESQKNKLRTSGTGSMEDRPFKQKEATLVAFKTSEEDEDDEEEVIKTFRSSSNLTSTISKKV